MEKYKIIDIKKDGDKETVLSLMGLNWRACTMRPAYVYRDVNFEIGDRFNIITRDLFDDFGTDIAYSYQAGGKYYVDLQIEPIIPSGLKEYCEKLGWRGRRELNGEIKRAMRSHGDVPSRSFETNLKLILGHNLYKVLSH